MEPRRWQHQFPVTRDWVYLDIANKAPLPLAVRDAWIRFLDEIHLRHEHRIHAFAALVAGKQVVAKRLDGVVEGHGDVRDVLVGIIQQAEHGRDDTQRALDVHPVRRNALGPLRVLGPKELKGAVDYVQAHGTITNDPARRCKTAYH